MYVSPVIKRKTSEATNVIIGQNVITEVLKCNRGVTGTIGDIIYWHSASMLVYLYDTQVTIS